MTCSDPTYARQVGLGSAEFDEAVRTAEAYADRLAADATVGRVDEMHAAYREATRFEWMFWDAAWRHEAWPEPLA